jgi:hypothetical protein
MQCNYAAIRKLLQIEKRDRGRMPKSRTIDETPVSHNWSNFVLSKGADPEMSDMLQLVADDAHSSSEERVSDDRQAKACRTSEAFVRKDLRP